MKAAIVGFGNIAEKAHLAAYRKLDVEVVAVVDVTQARRSRAESYGLRSYEKVEALREESIDFIDICTPPNARMEAIQFAVENELDVVCEKPLVQLQQMHEFDALLKKSSIFFFPVHNWKYSQQYRKVRELLNGEIATRSVRMNTWRTCYSYGCPEWNPGWRIKYEISGGGILMDHGYHNIYLASFLLGSNFKSTKLRSIEYYPNSRAEKKASFELHFPQGRKAEINLDWSAATREIRSIVYGDNKKIELMDNKLVAGDKTYEFDYGLSSDSVHFEWYVDMLRDFINNRDQKSRKFLEEGMKVLEALDELYRQASRI